MEDYEHDIEQLVRMRQKLVLKLQTAEREFSCEVRRVVLGVAGDGSAKDKRATTCCSVAVTPVGAALWRGQEVQVHRVRAPLDVAAVEAALTAEFKRLRFTVTLKAVAHDCW